METYDFEYRHTNNNSYTSRRCRPNMEILIILLKINEAQLQYSSTDEKVIFSSMNWWRQ